MNHIGQNVAKLRARMQITQKQMADKLKISQQEYSRIESKQIIKDEMLQNIADELGYDIDTIKNLDNSIIVYNNQNEGNKGSLTTNINSLEKIVELYERIIAIKDEQINSLKRNT